MALYRVLVDYCDVFYVNVDSFGASKAAVEKVQALLRERPPEFSVFPETVGELPPGEELVD